MLPCAKVGQLPTPGSYLSLNLKKRLKFTSFPTFASLPVLSGHTGPAATRWAARGEHIVPLTEPEAGQPSSPGRIGALGLLRQSEGRSLFSCVSANSLAAPSGCCAKAPCRDLLEACAPHVCPVDRTAVASSRAQSF